MVKSAHVHLTLSLLDNRLVYLAIHKVEDILGLSLSRSQFSTLNSPLPQTHRQDQHQE